MATPRAREMAMELLGGESHPLRFYVPGPIRPELAIDRRRADDPDGFNRRVRVRKVDDPDHPCHGQFGLFAARAIRKGERIGEYGGIVWTVTRQADTGRVRIPASLDTTYFADLSKDTDSASYVDGKMFGNEMSFANDYRGTRFLGPNAEIRRDGRGGLPVVALRTILKGREILFDYGEGYWRTPDRSERVRRKVSERACDGP
eukprot:jgi/Mesvir1/11372/Mv10272-RA.1